ncbi:hypothetical protein Mp_2g09890 [Marchantia polymorpha subsp. ruderalis]|uniref:Uncharacterized protein n=1 Tax=Marchantia polymorpha TaxID=3197 RepID=A0A2R6W8E3_MARPO|nr:hypothetical protein MARPO_0129s0015 [Marchantia polymorpha]BBN01741.1 hypothetical protein Mp_2g09890 [Marchantia polymorpha subsp. ruderalis]|eukprot:PTQ30125.1 hypothetical protein MARPO_0129s0015 [Marchantia polymorpha]
MQPEDVPEQASSRTAAGSADGPERVCGGGRSPGDGSGRAFEPPDGWMYGWMDVGGGSCSRRRCSRDRDSARPNARGAAPSRTDLQARGGARVRAEDSAPSKAHSFGIRRQKTRVARLEAPECAGERTHRPSSRRPGSDIRNRQFWLASKLAGWLAG